MTLQKCTVPGRTFIVSSGKGMHGLSVIEDPRGADEASDLSRVRIK